MSASLSPSNVFVAYPPLQYTCFTSAPQTSSLHNVCYPSGPAAAKHLDFLQSSRKSDSGLDARSSPQKHQQQHHQLPSSPSLAKPSRVYVDEAADDLVILGDKHAYFSKIRLLPQKQCESSSSSNKCPPPQLSVDRVTECCALRTKRGTIMAAKRSRILVPPANAASVSSPSSSRAGGGEASTVAQQQQTGGGGGVMKADGSVSPDATNSSSAAIMMKIPKTTCCVVAVAHDNTSIRFYHVPIDASSSSSAQLPSSDSFAAWECQPNTLRYGSGKYPIRSFYWIDSNNNSSASTPAASSPTGGGEPGGAATTATPTAATTSTFMQQSSYDLVGENSSGTLFQQQCNPTGTVHGSTSALLAVCSEICVDLLRISLIGAPVTLLKRISTRVDYFCYSPSANMLTLLNQSKPNIIKIICFDPVAPTATAAMTMVEHIKADDGTPLQDTPASTSQMQPPSFIAQVRAVVLYGDVYVMHLTARQEIVLYQMVLRQNASSASTSGGGPAGGSGNPSSSSSSSTAPFQGGGSSGDAQGAAAAAASFSNFSSTGTLQFNPARDDVTWQKAFVLRVLESESLTIIQIVDNLIVVHSPLSSLFFVYDIRIKPPPRSLTGLKLLDCFNSPLRNMNRESSSFASSSSTAAAGKSLSPPSAAQRQNHADPTSTSQSQQQQQTRQKKQSSSWQQQQQHPQQQSTGVGTWRAWRERFGIGSQSVNKGEQEVPNLAPTSAPYPLTLVDVTSPHCVCLNPGLQKEKKGLAEGERQDKRQDSANEIKSPRSPMSPTVPAPPNLFEPEILVQGRVLVDVNELEFYTCASLPVVLDRRHGTVSLMSLAVQHIAMTLPDQSLCIQFLLNRFGCGGLTIPRILQSMMRKYEPLPVIGHVMDLVCGSCKRTANNTKWQQHQQQHQQALLWQQQQQQQSSSAAAPGVSTGEGRNRSNTTMATTSTRNNRPPNDATSMNFQQQQQATPTSAVSSASPTTAFPSSPASGSAGGGGSGKLSSANVNLPLPFGSLSMFSSSCGGGASSAALQHEAGAAATNNAGSSTSASGIPASSTSLIPSAASLPAHCLLRPPPLFFGHRATAQFAFGTPPSPQAPEARGLLSPLSTAAAAGTASDQESSAFVFHQFLGVLTLEQAMVTFAGPVAITQVQNAAQNNNEAGAGAGQNEGTTSNNTMPACMLQVPLYVDAKRNTIDQLIMYKHVFSPILEYLSDLQLLCEERIQRQQQQQRPAAATHATTSNSSHHDYPSAEVSTYVYESRFLLYCLLEYSRCIAANHLKHSDLIQRLLVNVFITGPSPDYYRLHQILMYRAVDDHIAIAMQLLSLENVYPPAFQIALDMLSRTGAHSHILGVLLVKNMPLRAARYAVTRSHIMEPPVLQILESAYGVVMGARQQAERLGGAATTRYNEKSRGRKSGGGDGGAKSARSSDLQAKVQQLGGLRFTGANDDSNNTDHTSPPIAKPLASSEALLTDLFMRKAAAAEYESARIDYATTYTLLMNKIVVPARARLLLLNGGGGAATTPSSVQQQPQRSGTESGGGGGSNNNSATRRGEQQQEHQSPLQSPLVSLSPQFGSPLVHIVSSFVPPTDEQLRVYTDFFHELFPGHY